MEPDKESKDGKKNHADRILFLESCIKAAVIRNSCMGDYKSYRKKLPAGEKGKGTE